MWKIPPLQQRDWSGIPGVKIVALGCRERDRRLLAYLAERNHWELHFADTLMDAWIILNERKVPIFLCERELVGAAWPDVIQTMTRASHPVYSIVLARAADDAVWNEVIRCGAYDLLATPLREANLLTAIRLAWSFWNSAMKLPPLPFKHYR